jgi:hypothetical protein
MKALGTLAIVHDPYGYGPLVHPGPVMAGVLLGIFAIIGIFTLVNRRKWDREMQEDKASQDPPKPVGGPWKCPKCGQISEPQFESCWKCGTVREDPRAE